MGVAAHSTLGVQTFRREGRANNRGLTENVGTDVLTEAGNERFRAAVASLWGVLQVDLRRWHSRGPVCRVHSL